MAESAVLWLSGVTQAQQLASTVIFTSGSFALRMNALLITQIPVRGWNGVISMFQGRNFPEQREPLSMKMRQTKAFQFRFLPYGWLFLILLKFPAVLFFRLGLIIISFSTTMVKVYAALLMLYNRGRLTVTFGLWCNRKCCKFQPSWWRRCWWLPQRDAIRVAIETMKMHQDDFDEITLVLFGEREFGFAREDYPKFISTPSSTR